MDHHIVQPTPKSPAASTRRLSTDMPDSGAQHPVLSRLMEEVRNERQVEARYDRVHHRHNRGR